MSEETREALDQTAPAEQDTEMLQSLFARTSYQLRESRKALLARHGVDDEAGLLELIRRQGVAPHPAYEDYLSALLLEQTRQQIRAELAAHLEQRDEPAPVSLHLLLKDQLETHYGARLAEPVRLAQDALALSFDSGLMLEVRYFSREQYSIKWCWGAAERRIDTAPLADWTPHAGGDCWTHFSGLLELLLEDPLRAAFWGSAI